MEVLILENHLQLPLVENRFSLLSKKLCQFSFRFINETIALLLKKLSQVLLRQDQRHRTVGPCHRSATPTRLFPLTAFSSEPLYAPRSSHASKTKACESQGSMYREPGFPM
jgi:hypothetical protein